MAPPVRSAAADDWKDFGTYPTPSLPPEIIREHANYLHLVWEETGNPPGVHVLHKWDTYFDFEDTVLVQKYLQFEDIMALTVYARSRGENMEPQLCKKIPLTIK